MTGALPNFVIAGVMKCGTTSLARWLAEHGEVFLAPQKEVHFFDQHFDKGIAWYKSQFQGSDGKKAIGEGTPNYTYDEDTLGRMHETLPTAKIIMLFRNPIDRTYSHYWHNRTRGRTNSKFESVIDFEAGSTAHSDVTGKGLYGYVEQSRYDEVIARLVKFYPWNQIHVLLLDDMQARPQESYREVCRFLGVDDAVVPEIVGSPLNRFVEFRSPAVRRFAMRMPGPLRTVLGRVNSRRTEYPAMSPATRTKLVGLFAPYNERFGKLVGRDLSSWNK